MAMAHIDLLPLRSLVEEFRHDIRTAAFRHRGQRIAIFGSVARGEEDIGSDIDFLVEFQPGSSLFDLVRLQEELEGLLGHRVDVVSIGGLLARDDDILEDAVWL